MIRRECAGRCNSRISSLSTAPRTAPCISGPSNVFNVSKVLFVGWKAIFRQSTFGLDTNQYRVDAAYIGPDGGTLGSVDDIQTIKQT